VVNIILKRHDHVEPSTVLEALNRVADRILQVDGRGAGAGFSHCVMRDDSHVVSSSSSSSSSSSRSSNYGDKACDWKGSLCDGAISSSTSSYQLSSDYNSWKSCNDSSVPLRSAKKKLSKFTSPTPKSDHDHHDTNHSPYLFRIFVIFGLLLCCFMLLHVLQ
jgi:hypothetical protein